jgi:hypothetical protein
MAGDGGRGIRPWAWILCGALALPIGLLLLLIGIAATVEPDDISGLPTCRTDFGDDCLTEREALLVDRGYARRSWISREQKWIADVPEGAPYLEGEEKLALDIPRQPGREELAEGVRVRLVYYDDRAALVRLPSGRELETDDHPRRYAPMHGYLGLFGIGGGAFAVAAGWRAGRKNGFWRKAPARFGLGAGFVLALAGMVGALAQTLFGGARWTGLAGAAAGLGLGVWAALRSRSRGRD